jgi:hypothetical protein
MTIYRCNKCAFVSENTVVPVGPVGARANCERCNTPSMVFDTIFYVEKLVERYQVALREIDTLKQTAVGQSAPEKQSSPHCPHSLQA